jgi:hypothetical protein
MTGVDSEIPCFEVATATSKPGFLDLTPDPSARHSKEEDPELVHVDLLRNLHEDDPASQHLHHQIATDSSIEVDPAGVLGHVLQSGEFQVHVPHAPQRSLPIFILVDTARYWDGPSVRGDDQDEDG